MFFICDPSIRHLRPAIKPHENAFKIESDATESGIGMLASVPAGGRQDLLRWTRNACNHVIPIARRAYEKYLASLWVFICAACVRPYLIFCR